MPRAGVHVALANTGPLNFSTETLFVLTIDRGNERYSPLDHRLPANSRIYQFAATEAMGCPVYDEIG